MLVNARFARRTLGIFAWILGISTLFSILLITGCTSTGHSETIGPPAKLAFTVQPGSVATGSSITPAVAVSIEDANGNVVTTATNQITIAIGTNPSGGTLAGTATVNAVNGVATFSGLSINNAGSGYTLTASATGLSGATSTAFTVFGAGAKLVFTQQPTNVAAGSSITPAVAVSIEDAQGNVVASATNSVSIAIGTNPSGGTLSGTLSVAAVNGVATFSNLSINKLGTGYTLAASATGLTGATSSAFNVLVGAAAKLVFTQQPSNVVAGSSITPAVAVSIEDAQGNVVTTATNSVSIAIGTNPSGGTLGGTTPVSAVAGVATFSNLSINRAGTGYTLTASATGLTGTTSSTFNVLVGAAAKLAFTVQPSNVAAGSSVTPAVAVSVEDALGNVVITATNSVTIAIGTNPSGGTLSGTTPVSAVAGVATFLNLSINKAGTGYTLTASATGLTGATSSTFNVTAGAAAKLAFTQQPSNVVSGSSITPSVAVSIEDDLGNTVTTATNQITIAIGTNPPSGTLSGTKQVNAVAGVATFANLSLNNVGTGYTLTASATNLTGATSNTFNVTVGAASKLAFTVQPSNTTAGAPIGPSVQVTIQDNQGNTVTTATNQITVAIGTNPSSGTLSGTTQVSAAAGVAIFANLSINKSGTGYTLAASATSLTGVTSNTFNVTAGPAVQLAFAVEPANTPQTTGIAPAVMVSIEDTLGNVVTTATNQITIAIRTNPSSGTLSGTAQVNAVAGVATFSNLSINNIGTGYVLTASATNLTSATSSLFNITVAVGPPTKLVFTVQPSNVTAGNSITPSVQVAIEDSLGNTVTTATNQITIAIGTNPSSGTLSGTTQVNAVAGVATFSNLSINKAGTGYTLAASATNLTGATSNAFNVTVGAASKLAFTVQPSNTTAGALIAPSVQVTVEDSQGNTVTTATNQITVAIGTNPSSGTLSGTTAVSAVAGVATFANLSINAAGTGYTLAVSATSLTGATSNTFNVTAGGATQLVFTQQPSNVAAGSSITPAVTVSIEDNLGNVVTTATNQITIAIGTNPSSGTLSGTMQVNAVAGVATFSNLNINNVGTGYTLTASATGFTTITSNAFDVIVATASCTSAPSGHESVLNGRWVVLMQGWKGTGPGFPVASVFSFDASGTGSFVDVSGGSGITGSIDENNGDKGASSVFSGNLLTAGSSYKVGLDPTNNTGYLGCMTLASSAPSGGTKSLRFALSVNSGSAVRGRIIRWTDTSGNGSGNRASGVMLPQDATAFTGGNLNNLHTNYAFGEGGSDTSGGPFAIAGAFSLNTGNGQASATFDIDDAGSASTGSENPITVSGLSSTTGRASFAGTPSGSPTAVHTAMYIVNANEFFIVGIDPYVTNGPGIYSGRAIVTGTTFSNTSLSGNYILQTTNSSTGNPSCNNSGPCASVSLGEVGFSNGTINSTSTIYNYQQGSAVSTDNPSGSYAVAASGRMTVTPSSKAPVFYLATPQSNTEPIRAFIVGTDTGAAFGELTAGANSNVSVSSLAGNYIAGTFDPGDSTVNFETDVVKVDSSGNVTGYAYASDTSGLSEGPINNGGGGGSPVVTITNSPLPGFGNVGSHTYAITNGTLFLFIDPGSSNNHPASITFIQP